MTIKIQEEIIMSNETEIEVQIRELEEMQRNLGEFCMKMNQQIEDLRTDLHECKAQGFPREIAEKYEQKYYMSAHDKVQDIIARIRTAHHQYLESVIEQLKKTLNED